MEKSLKFWCVIVFVIAKCSIWRGHMSRQTEHMFFLAWCSVWLVQRCTREKIHICDVNSKDYKFTSHTSSKKWLKSAIRKTIAIPKYQYFVHSFCLPQTRTQYILMYKFQLMAVIVSTFLKVVLEVLLNCVK